MGPPERLFWPVLPVPGVKRSEITPVPRGAMLNGNCRLPARGFSLLLSQDPAFQSVIGDELRSEYVVGGFTPEQRTAWLQRLRGFVPIFLEGLESDNPCVQLDCITHLGLMAEPSAVEPLLRLLEKYPPDTEVAIAAMQFLASNYKEPSIVPRMVAVIQQGGFGTDLFIRTIRACQGSFKDERLFQALLRLFEDSKDHPCDKAVFSALYNQADDGHHKKEMTDLYRRHIADPAFASLAPAVARLMASPETFDEIASLYENGCKDQMGNCWGLYDILREIGGPKFVAFSRRQIINSEDPCAKNTNTAVVLEELQKEIPATFPPGQDLLNWLQQNAGDLLDRMDFCAILLKDPSSKPDVPPSRRAVYWERAAKLFERNKPIHSWIGLQLYKAYGPEGLDDPEKALKAITMALDDYQSVGGGKPGEWQQYKSNLERRLRTQRIDSVIRIDELQPSKPGEVLGTWKGILILPEEAMKEALANVPYAYLDYIDTAGKTTSVETEIQFVEPEPAAKGGLAFLAVPQSPNDLSAEQISGVRLRLLFLPRSTGFTGHVTSTVVPTH